MKALTMMKTNTSVKTRADKYATTIKRNLQTKMIDSLIQKKEDLDQKIFNLQDFSLETDLNRGQAAMTTEQCQERFEQIIQLEFDMKMIELELKVKQESFDSYFKSK